MKYDSGMTQFRNDIIAVLQYMLKSDPKITKEFRSNDGSPAPLRDYLKQKYGKSYTSHIGNGMRYSCKTATGVELAHGDILNNDGDKTLTLTWSQTAKFIRDNWNEIFNKSGSEEDKPSEKISYIDMLRKRYPKVNETDEWFDTVYCPSDLFDGNGVNDPGDDKCDYTTKDDEACQKCWRERCPTDADSLIDLNFEKAYFEHYPAEDTAEADAVPEISEEKTAADNPSENQVAAAAETALQGAFDYSGLDNDTAKNLRECETVIRRETAGYFTLLGAKFKEAQSLLADHVCGTFEKWYTAIGFKRQTVYNLIQRYDFLGSPTIGGREDTFEALPLTLSYEVSKADAPSELVEKVLNGDITTNAEYLKLKAELDRTREECRQLDSNSAAKDKEYERRLEEADKRAKDAEFHKNTVNESYKRLEATNYRHYTNLIAEQKKNSELENRIKELENRPVDVAVQRDEGLLKELEELREENTRLKDDGVKSFLVRLTLDEYEELLKAVGKKPLLADAVRHAKIIKL